MNEYKLTYTTNGESRALTARRIDRTEASARKAFLKDCKERGVIAEVTSIEFVRDDAIATKQQERETLAAIRMMVEELGPQSYLATAFEGCFEDAESNIENDFGDSYKRRCESLERKLDEAGETIERMKNDIKLLSNSVENERALVKSLEEQLSQQALSADDLTDCKQLVENLLEELRGKVKAAEGTILEYAEHPETTTFCNAVRERKSLTGDIGYYTALLERLERLTNIQSAA